MKPLWIVLGIILQIAGIAIGILYFEDNWLVIFPMGTLIAIGSMLILFGVTLGGKPQPQAAPKPAAAPVVTNQPTTVQAAPAQAAAVTATSSDPTEQLKKLAELHKSGVLTDEEYAAAKKKVLDI